MYLLNRYTARWTDLVVAVSPAVRSTLLTRDHIPPDKIRILENGIDLDAVDAEAVVEVRREIGADSREVILCTAGRLIPDKGHRYLLGALARLAPGNSPVRLIVVGDGPERSSLRREVAALGLDERVHFLGYRHDLVGILKSVDVFVLPSLEEGVPVVALEAMACSLPVVATQVGGVPDVVKNEVTGLLVPPAEDWELGLSGRSSNVQGRNRLAALRREKAVNALAGALSVVVHDLEVRRRLGAAGRSRVEGEHSFNAVVCRLESFYGPSIQRPAPLRNAAGRHASHQRAPTSFGDAPTTASGDSSEENSW